LEIGRLGRFNASSSEKSFVSEWNQSADGMFYDEKVLLFYKTEEMNLCGLMAATQMAFRLFLSRSNLNKSGLILTLTARYLCV
jgi:hypothetical protein